MSVLISNKAKFLQDIHNIQFELLKQCESRNLDKEVIELLKQYLEGKTNFSYSYLEFLAPSNPIYQQKLELYRKTLIPFSEKLTKKDLEIFISIISKEIITRPLVLYRGTSKTHFGATNLINNDSNLLFEDLKVGDHIQTLTPQSTTLNPFVAKEFFCGSENGYLLIEYNIENRPLFLASPYSTYEELEFIMPPNQEFTLEEIKHVDLDLKDLERENKSINYIKVRG